MSKTAIKKKVVVSEDAGVKLAKHLTKKTEVAESATIADLLSLPDDQRQGWLNRGVTVQVPSSCFKDYTANGYDFSRLPAASVVQYLPTIVRTTLYGHVNNRGVARVGAILTLRNKDGYGHGYALPPETIITKVQGPEAAMPSYMVLEATARKIAYGKRSDYVGSDPEMFVVNGKGELIPAFLFLGPQKKGQVTPFYDGYQAEFGTNPQTCLEYHSQEVCNGMVNLLEAARQYDRTARLSLASVVTVGIETLKNENPKYTQFGCTPSLSAYGESPMDVDPLTIPFRMAGGHLHFSHPSRDNIPAVIKALDAVLGVICVSLFQRYDDPRRRSLYGKAGEYRLTKYGFEYRTLSNAWMVHPCMKMFVYEVARRVIAGNHSKPGIDGWVADEAEVRKCINECDVALAHKILDQNNSLFEALLLSLPSGLTSSLAHAKEIVAVWKRVVKEGVHNFLRNPDEVSSAWRLASNGEGFNLARNANIGASLKRLLNGQPLD